MNNNYTQGLHFVSDLLFSMGGTLDISVIFLLGSILDYHYDSWTVEMKSIDERIYPCAMLWKNLFTLCCFTSRFLLLPAIWEYRHESRENEGNRPFSSKKYWTFDFCFWYWWVVSSLGSQIRIKLNDFTRTNQCQSFKVFFAFVRFKCINNNYNVNPNNLAL